MSTESLYQTYKTMLFSLAYRILGSVMDAEDIVQEAFITFDQLPNRDQIENPKAYLSKIVTNRCIDLVRSSTKTRESYVGPWLPEPLVECQQHDPSQIYLNKESISTAYLLLLQQLNEVERAVFLLREVFHYSYDEIAEMVGKSNANCRQIFHRAKKSIHYEPQQSPTIATAEQQVKKFIDFLLEGDVDQLLQLVSKDVVLLTDGGGKVKAAHIPIIGAAKVIQLSVTLTKMYTGQFTLSLPFVNGWPGVVLTMEDRTIVYSFHFKGNQIQTIYSVANPDKLHHVNRLRPF